MTRGLCSRQLLRRSSEGGLGSYEVGGVTSAAMFPNTAAATAGLVSTAGLGTATAGVTRSYDSPMMTTSAAGRRAYSSLSGRMGSRSWHPSPFQSDDDGTASAASDEPQFYKEEKKSRIKMEIARRRQQIEENACLHEELTRLAKLRESADATSASANAAAAVAAAAGIANPALGIPPVATTSVLKSVDEILRDDPYRTSRLHNPTFNSDVYTASVYDRVADFSPINDVMAATSAASAMDPTGKFKTTSALR